LNATASVPGSFAYTPSNGTVLNAGTNTPCFIFTPADTVDYSTVTDCLSLVVLPAPLSLGLWPMPKQPRLQRGDYRYPERR
jgi:hypothetical protein